MRGYEKEYNLQAYIDLNRRASNRKDEKTIA
jgi:hypothetical protein